jgi:quinol monooxygenase YgiN
MENYDGGINKDTEMTVSESGCISYDVSWQRRALLLDNR